MKNIEEKIIKEVFYKILKKYQNIVENSNSSKISFGNYDTWEDPPIAYKDSDPNITDKTQKFALLMDKVAELLGLPEPIITSGLRPPERQVKAMLNLWKNNGSQYVIELYAEKCKSCSSAAGDIARELVDLWDENKIIDTGGVPEDIVNQSIQIVANSPLSAHQNGDALDYGIRTNPGDNIKRIVDYIGEHGYATYELIDETQGAGPHWHISVDSITSEGIIFLDTNNQEIIPEHKKLKQLINLIIKEELIKTNK
jgi:hypothetical protein